MQGCEACAFSDLSFPPFLSHCPLPTPRPSPPPMRSQQLLAELAPCYLDQWLQGWL